MTDNYALMNGIYSEGSSFISFAAVINNFSISLYIFTIDYYIFLSLKILFIEYIYPSMIPNESLTKIDYLNLCIDVERRINAPCQQNHHSFR